MAKIAVIGLGVMGLPMAQNLVAKGHDVIGMEPSADALEPAEIVLTMLPEGAHVAKACEEAVLPGAARHALLIDFSAIHRTLGPSSASE